MAVFGLRQRMIKQIEVLKRQSKILQDEHGIEYVGIHPDVFTALLEDLEELALFTDHVASALKHLEEAKNCLRIK